MLNSLIISRNRINRYCPADMSSWEALSKNFNLLSLSNLDFIAVMLDNGDYDVVKCRHYDNGVYSPRDFKLLILYIDLLEKNRD